MAEFEPRQEHRQWKVASSDCPTNDHNYSDLGGLKEVLGVMLDNSERGYGVSCNIEATFDLRRNAMRYSERIDAAMHCAQKIVSGECPLYVYTGAFSPTGRA